jgi:hypothetical protein
MRTSVPAAMAAFALAAALLVAGAGPASAAPAPSPSTSPSKGPYVEPNPSTARVGDEIALRASCVENLQPATVNGPFGTVTVQPDNGFLTATNIVISADTAPGTYTLTLTCPAGTTGAKQLIEGKLYVVERTEPTQGPATGGGGTAPGRNAPLMIGGGAAALVLGLVLAATTLIRRRRFG